MSNLWKITKCNAAGADLSGLSLQRNGSWRTIALAAVQNLLSQSSTMARLVFRIMVRLIGTIGLWLMVSCIYLASVLVIGAIASVLTMWFGITKLSVVTTKLKRTLKG